MRRTAPVLIGERSTCCNSSLIGHRGAVYERTEIVGETNDVPYLRLPPGQETVSEELGGGIRLPI
jgi:hypothetical protein